jgi:uncharacterized membrane protein
MAYMVELLSPGISDENITFIVLLAHVKASSTELRLWEEYIPKAFPMAKVGLIWLNRRL